MRAAINLMSIDAINRSNAYCDINVRLNNDLLEEKFQQKLHLF
jgi:hypothetical protein